MVILIVIVFVKLLTMLLYFNHGMRIVLTVVILFYKSLGIEIVFSCKANYFRWL